MKKKHKLAYIFLLIILLSLVFLLAVGTYNNYSKWQRYHNFFKKPGSKIEPWMSIRTISKHFNLTYNQIFSVIGKNNSLNNHISLDRFCRIYNKNCTEIVSTLNNLTK